MIRPFTQGGQQAVCVLRDVTLSKHSVKSSLLHRHFNVNIRKFSADIHCQKTKLINTASST